MIKISLKAKIFLQNSLEKSGKKYCFLSVLSGGCSGFQYHMDLTDTNIKDTTLVDNILLVDNYSLEILGNSVINLKEDIGFKQITIDNPGSTASCSCGKSFAI